MIVAVIIYYKYYVIIPLIIAIQILYVPERQYWVATSYIDAELKLYDSMFTGELTASLEEQLVRIYLPLAHDESLVITAVCVQQQGGGTDCGLFATAFALHTVMRKNFKTICFEQNLMKKHLLECLQNETLTEFPQSTSPSAKPRRSKVSHIVINLFCTCRMPESFDSKMIECDRCADWFQMCGSKKEHYIGQLDVYKMLLVHLTV